MPHHRPTRRFHRAAVTNGTRLRPLRLKTPPRDGTTHGVFEPLGCSARLTALVPKPRVQLTRFHGVFAPNSAWRAQVTPAKRGKPDSKQAHKTLAEPGPYRSLLLRHRQKAV